MRCLLTSNPGSDFWHTAPIPRLKIPALRLSDGPNGVRGIRFFDGVPAACFPCGTALGATFDIDLLQDVGRLLGDEAKTKGAHVLLGPTINIQRSPLGGRGFESFSEDPFLSGTLAGAYCLGVKEKDIIPTIKHFVCNDQEHERMAVDSILTDRALREIYLMPFMLAIKMSQPPAVMTAYNKVNGTHVSENHKIIDILRKDWNWQGLLMSDWYGTYTTSEAIIAGLDLEMPGPTRWRTDALSHAVISNKVKEHVLDESVRVVLNTVKLAAKSGILENQKEGVRDCAEDRALLRRVAAESIVLLKNENNSLPLDRTKTVAVIGPNSKMAAFCGGGSAALLPYYAVTPFEGVTKKCENIRFAQGAYGHKELPKIGEKLQTPDGGRQGFRFRAYDQPSTCSTRDLIDERYLVDSRVFLADYKNNKLSSDVFYVEMDATFTPEEDGLFDFGLAVHGTADLYIDNEILIDNTKDQVPGSVFFGSGTIEKIQSLKLNAGQSYKIHVEFSTAATSDLESPGIVSFGYGGFRLGGCKRLDPEGAITQAVDLAKEVDQVVVFAGLNGDWESEGFDRPHMDLPQHSDDLITRVLEANPKAVVVNQSGTPVTMPWIDQAGAVVQAWYGGNETGNAIADVLFGDVNPCGKLSLSYPKKLSHNPAYLNYCSEGGRVLYGEDIYVGYRYYDKLDLPPLFPFGHGLSYTAFNFSALHIQPSPASPQTHLEVSIAVKNIGDRKGKEVVQVYVAQAKPSIRRAIKELKGYGKVELAPGEEKRVSVEVEKKYACAFWEERRERWLVEKGHYRVLVGRSSHGPFLEGQFDIEETSSWVGL